MNLCSVYDYFKIANYSPNGELIVLCQRNKLIVVVAKEALVLREVEIFGEIKDVNWCKDDTHLLYLICGKNTVFAFSLDNKKWTCTISTGAEDIHSAMWSPSGRNIITITKFNITATVWSLEGLTTTYIENRSIIGNNSFSSSGLFYAVPALDGTSTRVYETKTWTSFSEIVHEEHLQSVPVWAPFCDHFCLFNNLDLKRCYVAIFAVNDGKQVGRFERKGKGIVGVRSIEWSPSGQLLAIECFDNCIYVIEHILWSVIGKFEYVKHVSEMDVKVYKTVDDEYAELRYRPITFRVANYSTKPKLLHSVNQRCFNQQGTLLANVFESTPDLVWVWDILNQSLMSVTALSSAVTDLKWGDPSTLVICNSSSSVTMVQNGVATRILLQDVKEEGEVIHSLECDETGTYITLIGNCKIFLCRLHTIKYVAN